MRFLLDEASGGRAHRPKERQPPARPSGRPHGMSRPGENALEDALDSIQMLPLEVRRHMELICWLDLKWHKAMHEYK